MAVRGCMKTEPLKEGRKWNKGLAPHRPAPLKNGALLLKSRKIFLLQLRVRGGIRDKDPKGGTDRQQIKNNDFWYQSGVVGFTLHCAEQHRINSTVFQKKPVYFCRDSCGFHFGWTLLIARRISCFAAVVNFGRNRSTKICVFPGTVHRCNMG